MEANKKLHVVGDFKAKNRLQEQKKLVLELKDEYHM